MDTASYLAILRDDGTALLEAAERNPSAPCPCCPGWDAAGLVAHVGGVHRRIAEVLRTGGPPGGRAEPPEGFEELAQWYREGLAGLVEELGGRDPAEETWSWAASGRRPVAWWARRMALETAVHRFDAAVATGADQTPLPPRLGVEGIEEFLTEILPDYRRRHGADLPGEVRGTLHLHASDAEGEWWVDFNSRPPEVRREHAKAATALRGPASGLYLWLLNRLQPEGAGLEVHGDRDLLEAWQAVRF